ncbi:MAG: type VI secretion system tube protein Hcp [Rhizobacter sp.]|nr:type VI secretion system tube protein Hcp [Rhizobacter sp.]
MKDIYVKFTKKSTAKEIKGESLDDAHKGGTWLEVSSFTHGIVQPRSATASSAGGHTSERCEHLPMVFTKDVDTASVYLWEACSAGYQYDVEIEFFRANGTNRVKYMAIKLTNAIVEKVDMTVPMSGLPVETFALKYAKVVWKHTGSKTDGSAGTNDVGGWDLAANKAAAA